MQLVMNIDDELYEIIKNPKKLETMYHAGRLCEAVRKGTPLPKGATNGDRIKVIFPDCKDWKAKIEDNDGEVYEVHFVQLPNSMTINKYEESWWNAPYKAESKEQEAENESGLKMSIDRSKRILIDRYIDTYVVCGGANYNPTINITREDYEAFKVAIGIMCKYREIQEIVTE